METKIRSVRKNPLLDRNKLEVEVDHEGESTPSKEDVKGRVAAENDLNTDEIEVKSVYTGYGSNTSKATLLVYQEFDYDEELEETSEEVETGPTEEETEETGEEYEEAVSGTISDAKDALKEMEEPDYEAALKAEKQNKDRKTLKQWLENQIE